ncbi:MAG: ISAs1 family transposase [Firmicutes bacterium]|nr:ISAs1 family transposase [Bacillota bacterium]
MKKILGANTDRRTISIDGKTVRSTEKMSTYENALHIASAIIAESKLVIGSLPCDTKISEPEIFRELMEMLDVEGAIVVADALHCRKKSAQKVIDEKADYTSSNIDWLHGKEDWAELKTIGAVHTEFEKNGEKTDEWHYYISSAKLNAEELLKHARLEWTVESMHWLLDVHYAEDKTRVWDKNIQQTLNVMRKIALNLARKYKTEKEPKKQ